jgi:D-aminopeptidase
LKRVARRLTIGLARTGSVSGNGSGDLFLAFSTANAALAARGGVTSVKMLNNERIDPLFTAAVQATEEAIINAMIAADTMVGIDGHRAEAIPHDQSRAVMKKYGR